MEKTTTKRKDKKSVNDFEFHERDDWTLFRTLDGIQQRTGIKKIHFGKAVVKELLDNALDASSFCRFGFLTDGGFFIENIGKGLLGNDDEIADLFSINRPLRSTKLYRLPTRGALGNGLRFITGVVLATKGTLKVMTKGRSLQLFPQYHNGKTHYERLGDHPMKGTRIEITIPGYEDKDIFEWGKKAKQLKSETVYKGKTSPYWYNVDDFHALMDSAPEGLTIARFLEKFDGCTGEKSWNISKDFSQKNINKLTINDAEELLRKMQKVTKPVNPERLGFVGELTGFESYYKLRGQWKPAADKMNITTIIPYVIEAWTNNSDKPSVNLFVNRTHVAQDVYTYMLDNNKKQYINDCGISCKVPVKSPKEIWISIITPYFPMKSSGKEPDLSNIRENIFLAIHKAVEKLEKASKASGKKYKKTFKGVVLDTLTQAINKASDDLKYRYSLRQLYYVSRGFVNEILGTELTYNNFIKIITGYENEIGSDLPNIYRDDRGSVYHPHLRETIRLGTRSVETYKKPEWIFNKILYAEKEGFIEILRSAEWAEKNDCLLLTSKGYATRAARDILDLLSESDEELLFFCVHDADTDGTLIYQALMDASKARPQRKVKIIDLGLFPKEGIKLNLQVEKVKKKKVKSVSQYVPPHWKNWYKDNRIELNAMDTQAFIRWLDEKIEKYTNGKLIPPDDIITGEFENYGHSQLKTRIKDKLIKEAEIDERTVENVAQLFPKLKEKYSTEELKHRIEEDLDENPYLLWKKPLQNLTDDAVDDILEE